MARISTYVNDTDVVGADKWIGSDSQNNFQTKNFTAADVARFINGAGNESQTFKYLIDSSLKIMRNCKTYNYHLKYSILN